ncbi:MAG: hypothetical protein HYU66_17080 [Armatimonadetes bacterium]|nr:hypothetical protein [Armatimonadota bacterium]
MNLDEMFEQVYEGELRAEEMTDLREALERRLEGLRREQQPGEDADEHLEAMAHQLAVLREEELVAEFIERALSASLSREEILKRLGEREDEAFDA